MSNIKNTASVKEQGFSLIESLLVVVVIASAVFLISNIPNALGLIGKSNHTSLAREIAVKQIEDKRSLSYENLVNDSSPISDSRISLLPEGSGSVVVSDCPASICTSGEAVKQVLVTINWKDLSKDQELKLTTMIGEGGINQ